MEGERAELAVAERVLRRLYEQEAGATTAEQEAEATVAEQNAGTPRPVQVSGRSVVKVPHRSEPSDGWPATATPYEHVEQWLRSGYCTIVWRRTRASGTLVDLFAADSMPCPAGVALYRTGPGRVARPGPSRIGAGQRT